MCFSDDYDWIAQSTEEWEESVEVPTRCVECREFVEAGGMMHFTKLQEYEECYDCDYEGCECEKGKCCACQEPNYGQTITFAECDGCHKFLQAIMAAEHEEGCTGIGSRPPVGEMIDAIGQVQPKWRAEEVRRYVRKALSMFPELRPSGYITRIAKRLLA